MPMGKYECKLFFEGAIVSEQYWSEGFKGLDSNGDYFLGRI